MAQRRANSPSKADSPGGRDPAHGLRPAFAEWNDPSRTDIVTKPSGLRTSDERWSQADHDRQSDPGRLSDYGTLSDCGRLSEPGRRSDYGSLSIHARRSEATPPFIPAEDDPTVRVPPEVTEALLGGRSYRDCKLDEPAAALVTMALELDNPTVVDGWANVPRTKDAGRDARSARERAPSQDGEQTRTQVHPFSDEATDVDVHPGFSGNWLPPAPRVPAEFAPTTPPSALQQARGPRSRLARTFKLLVAGALLTGASFMASRANYDPAFRARATHSATSLWHAVQARIDGVRAQPPPAPPAQPPAAMATPAPAETRADSARPAPSTSDAASDAAPLKILQIEDLPLASQTEVSADDAESPRDKARKKRPR